MRRRPGRPRKVRPAPTADELSYLAQVNEQREQHVERDPLVQVLGGQGATHDVLHGLKVGIAREAAALRFDREQAAASGRPIEQLISRRIDALHKIALIELGIRRLRADDYLDIHGPQMQKAFALFLGVVQGVAAQTLPDGHEFATQLGQRFAGWEARVG